MTKYIVRLDVEVEAETPYRAATVARDMMLDPDSDLNVDVLPMEYCEAADDYFPSERRGWYAQFKGAVRPMVCFEWMVFVKGGRR